MIDKSTILVNIIVALSPILVALIGIIPTIISNRKKTEKSIEALKAGLKDSNMELKQEMQKTNDALRDELKADSAKTNAKVEKIEEQLSRHIEEGEEDQIKTTRYRILRFYDEVCESRWHSESHFEDILEDIDEYEKYCEEHPNFKNNRCKAASKRIKDVYEKVKAEGGFALHKE